MITFSNHGSEQNTMLIFGRRSFVQQCTKLCLIFIAEVPVSESVKAMCTRCHYKDLYRTHKENMQLSFIKKRFLLDLKEDHVENKW